MLLWPIILLTLALFGYVIYVFATMERENIMADWASNRCGIFVMFAASYFKPDDDPRTPGEFSLDNIRFCMGQLSKAAMAAALAPYNTILNQQSDNVSTNGIALNYLRKVSKNMMDAFMSFIDPFFRKFKDVSYQIGIIVQHLKMAMGRVNAILTSFIYQGLSLITGLQNMIQFIIVVIMIILAILIALLIIFFFIIFPFIPTIIVPVIVIIIAAAVGTMAGAASSMQGSFCFEPRTPVRLLDGSTKPISEVHMGDMLEGGGTVEGILQMDGSKTILYELDGIRVSGSHLVYNGERGVWLSVSEDSRATPIIEKEPILYCLNTSNRIIPVETNKGTIQQFRDWEEIAENDIIGQAGWDALVSKIVGVSGSNDDTFSLMDGRNTVLTENGIKTLNMIRVGDSIQLSYNRSTKVIGIVDGRVKGGNTQGWMSGCIERVYMSTERPYRRLSTIRVGKDFLIGRHLITECGEFIVNVNGSTIMVRDFTEVGADRIHLTYPFVSERLNANKSF